MSVHKEKDFPNVCDSKNQPDLLSSSPFKEATSSLISFTANPEPGTLLCEIEREGQSDGIYTVEPPNKGHFGGKTFVPCREVVTISEVK